MPHNATLKQPVNMVLGQLLTNGIHDEKLVNLFAETPRELFVPRAQKGAAYGDEDLSLGNGRVLMQPLSFAKMIKAAALKPEHRVLIIGALHGYLAALVSPLVSTVIAIENSESYLASARDNLTKIGAKNVELVCVKNLANGYAHSAPYDVIMVAGGVEIMPLDLLTQLAVQGKLLAVKRIGTRFGVLGGLGKLTVFSRVNDATQQLEIADMTGALLPSFEQPEQFVL